MGDRTLGADPEHGHHRSPADHGHTRSEGCAPREHSTRNQITGIVHGSAIQANTITSPITVIDQSGSVPHNRLTEAADMLAMAVAMQWRPEEERRRVHDPFPLPVRWQTAPGALTDHPANIHRACAGTTAEPLELTGQVDQIVEVYQRIPAKRLVILGRAGSGKTILALRLVLDLLETRASTDPVPVLVSIGSWNPTTTSLRDWLANQLTRDYPGLAVPGPTGGSLATAMIATGRIVPVLDGFDEIAEGLHRAALEAFNATSLPLVVTSRPAEYADAVARTDVLTGAAGIELADLTVTDLVGYLPRTTRKAASRDTTATVWDPVLRELRDRPESAASGNLAQVLRTPLMVMLARTIYSDTPEHDPAVLLDTDRFSTPEALEDHLLETFIPTVYRRQPGDRQHWDPDRVQRWLGYLAGHLDRLGTRDLAWWQLGMSMRRSWRALLVGLATGLAIGAMDWIGSMLQIGLFEPWGLGIVLLAGLLSGLTVGVAAGSAFGLVHGLAIRFRPAALEPSRVHIRILDRTKQTRAGFVPRFRTGFLFGLAGGTAFGLAAALIGLLAWLTSRPFGFGFESGAQLVAGLVNLTVFYGLMFGLGSGLTAGLVARCEAPGDIASAATPADLIRTNRRTVILQVLLFGPVFGLTLTLGNWLAVTLRPGLLGSLGSALVSALWLGVLGALAGGLGYVLGQTAWGQWVVFARIWLPMTGRLPWAVLAFLSDAHQRGVLRQTGAMYQFRHARLQDHLTAKPPAAASVMVGQ